MKEKILAFLKTKLTGIQEAYLIGVADTYSKTVTKEEEIETTITPMLDLIKLSAQQLQVEGDRRATEAQKTALKNFLDKHGLNEDGTPKKKEEPVKPPSDAPDWFKAFQVQMTEQTQKLNDKLASMEAEKTYSALLAKMQGKLKEKEIPEWFSQPIIRNLKIESEDKIDQLVTQFESDYATSKQKMVEEGIVVSVPASPKGGAEGEGVAVAKAIADKRNTSKSDGIQGKKV